MKILSFGRIWGDMKKKQKNTKLKGHREDIQKAGQKLDSLNLYEDEI